MHTGRPRRRGGVTATPGPGTARAGPCATAPRRPRRRHRHGDGLAGGQPGDPPLDLGRAVGHAGIHRRGRSVSLGVDLPDRARRRDLRANDLTCEQPAGPASPHRADPRRREPRPPAARPAPSRASRRTVAPTARPRPPPPGRPRAPGSRCALIPAWHAPSSGSRSSQRPDDPAVQSMLVELGLEDQEHYDHPRESREEIAARTGPIAPHFHGENVVLWRATENGRAAGPLLVRPLRPRQRAGGRGGRALRASPTPGARGWRPPWWGRRCASSGSGR